MPRLPTVSTHMAQAENVPLSDVLGTPRSPGIAHEADAVFMRHFSSGTGPAYLLTQHILP